MIYPVCTLGPSSTDTTDRFANPFHPRAWSGTDLGGRIPHACTIRNLKIQRVAGPGAGVTATYTFRRNNADTALACAISGTSLTGSDGTNEVSYVDGDQVSIKFRATGPGLGTPAASVVHISFDVETAESNYSINCLMLPTPTAGGTPVYTPAYGWPNGSLWFGGPLTDIHQGSSLIGPPGTLKYVRVWLASGAPGAAKTITILCYKNEVRQDGTGGTVDTRVTLSGASQIDGTATFDLPFTTGDRWALACEGTGTPVVGNTGVSWVYEADTDGAFFIGCSPPATGLATADRFNAPHDTSAAGWTGTESAHTIKAGLSGLTLSGFTALTNAADDGRVFALRRNGADTAAIDTMASSSRTAQGLANIFYPDGATFCLRTARATSTAINQAKYVFWGGVGADVEEPPDGIPAGGGEVENGPQPDPGVVPTTFPLLFAVFKDVAGDHAFVFGETQLNDDFDWYGGKKPGKIANVSPITRRLSRGGAFEGVRCTLTIADTDRTFRDFLETTPARGISIELFLIDDALRRTASGPLTPVAFRIFCGRVTGHRAPADWTYVFEILDVLTQRLAEFNKQPLLPPDVLSSDVFGTLDPALQGKAAPIVIGRVTDIDGPVLSSVGPQGAVPLLSLGGPFNLSSLGGSWPSVNVDVFLLTKGAIPDWGVIDGYYNEPDTPGVRLEIPESAYGVVIWVPTKPGWQGADNFIDYMGERYTPVFIDRAVTLGGLTVAEAIREGRMLVAFNMVGVVETIAGGDDRYIDYPARIWQWLLQNYCFTRYQTGDYADMPLLEGTYGVIDWESVEATVATHAARLGGGENYVSGFTLGGDGRQRALFDVLGELCQGADMDQGINRHGQLMISADDFNAEPEDVHIFDATRHIEDEQFEQWIDDAAFVNRVEHQYSPVYLPPRAPNPVPDVGQPVPKFYTDYAKFQSGVIITEDTTSQTDVNEIATLHLENYVIRDEATADDVQLRILSRGVGPGKDGPRAFRLTGGYRLFGVDDTIVELGTVIGYKHPAKIGDPDVIDTGRVMAITVDPIRKRVTLEGYLLNTIVGP